MPCVRGVELGEEGVYQAADAESKIAHGVKVLPVRDGSICREHIMWRAGPQDTEECYDDS